MTAIHLSLIRKMTPEDIVSLKKPVIPSGVLFQNHLFEPQLSMKYSLNEKSGNTRTFSLKPVPENAGFSVIPVDISTAPDAVTSSASPFMLTALAMML